MFLKIATVFAILGILLASILSLAYHIIVNAQLLNSSMYWLLRLMNVGESISLYVPLFIFLVAFFLSLRNKTA